MSAYSDAVEALSGLRFFLRFGEAAGSTFELDTANSRRIDWTGGPTFETPSGLAGDSSFAMTFNTPTPTNAGGDSALTFNLINGATAFTVCFWAKVPTGGGGPVIWFGPDTSNQTFYVDAKTSNTFFRIRDFLGGNDISSRSGLPVDTWTHVAIVYDAGAVQMYLDGVAETPDTLTVTAGLGVAQTIWIARDDGFLEFVGSLDDLSVHNVALTAGEVETLYNAGAGIASTESIPALLQAFGSYAAASVPAFLQAATAAAAASLPTLFQGLDATHFASQAATWAARVQLGGVDLSDRLVGVVDISAEEDVSGLCEFRFIPSPGPFDLSTYENQRVTIDYVAVIGGVEAFSARRFTGITTTATWSADRTVLTIEGTNDLQGKLENASRSSIDSLIGGSWSKYIFDDGADGWQYARDVLSTIPSCMYVDPVGNLTVTPWARSTAVVFTDATRFADTLELVRNTRRDLISENTINLDFRFVRLRHREIQVVWTFTPGLCGYLEGDAEVPEKSAISQAADGSAWTRTSAIAFVDLPPGQTITCGGVPRAWVGGATAFCIGASWTAARRWAQDVTEQYALTVKSVDIEQAVGRQPVSESYGVQALFDSRGWEIITAFDGPPAGASLSAKSQDYQLDATDVENGGRLELEHAQQVALAKAKTEILGRARGNEVTCEVVFDPAITLAATAQITTPHLSATGKVQRYTEQLEVERARVSQTITLAISRHGGSGSGITTPLDPAPVPDQPQETPTARTYPIGVEIGGKLESIYPEPAGLAGWITNAYGAARTAPANLYDERFVLRMPEIEETARNESRIVQPVTYEIEVPVDPLTLAN